MIDDSPLSHPVHSLRLASLVLLAGFATLAAHPAAAGEPVTPIPAPGQSLPKHAAGGWPTETSSDARPARSPEQQARLDSVAGELKRIAETHGPDAVVLQSKLLIRAMGAGAIGATEVRVAGPSTSMGPSHLEIDVDTGIFFDSSATTAESRRDQVFTDVALPVLDEMTSFNIDPQALELVLLFDVQDPAHLSGGKLNPIGEARCEAFRVRIDRPTLNAISSNDVAGDALRGKVEVTAAEPATRPPRVPVP